jgi:hypothetical protein
MVDTNQSQFSNQSQQPSQTQPQQFYNNNNQLSQPSQFYNQQQQQPKMFNQTDPNQIYNQSIPSQYNNNTQYYTQTQPQINNQYQQMNEPQQQEMPYQPHMMEDVGNPQKFNEINQVPLMQQFPIVQNRFLLTSNKINDILKRHQRYTLYVLYYKILGIFSPVLRDKKVSDIFTKKLEPIGDEYQEFGIRIPDLKKFCILITDLSYFLSLTLQGNLVDDEMIKWLVPGLITNQTLRELDLSSNKITQKGMIKICSYLVRTRALISLDLTNNLINGDASYAIGLVIKENTRLRILKLAMNRLDDVAGARITKMLSRNKYLIELDLSNNLLGQETLNNLHISLKFNNTIKVVNLCHNEIEMTDETKKIADNHPTLIELNMRHTLSTKENVEELENILIKKAVKLKLGNKNIIQ